MSMIDEERMSELASRMEANPVEGEATEQADGQEEVAESTEEQPTSEEQTGVDTESPTSTEEEETGHAVPYQRFQKVIKARNAHQAKITELEATIQDLQESLKGSAEPPKSEKPNADNDAWLDELLNGQEEETSNNPEYERLTNRVQQMEVAEQERVLEKELQTVAQTYPDVPRELLLQSVIQNPNTDLLSVAEKYSTFIAGIEEGAIARHTATVAAQAPKSAPRPKQAGSRHSNTPTSRDANPATMTKEQRYHALRQILNQ